jgi:galactose mutarotase-like enzyme
LFILFLAPNYSIVVENTFVFSISRQRRQPYDTYILSDQVAQSRLEIVPERGGIVTSWQVQGRELLYMDTERFTQPNLSVRGGIPVLFPICGNLPNQTYAANGQNYRLKQHGFARDQPWEVIEQQTQTGVSVTLELCSNEQTRAVYPFEFQLAFTYALRGNTLATRQRYTNHSAVPMPFSAGFHPYFLVIAKNQLRFDLPATEAIDQSSHQIQDFANAFDFARDEIDWAFPHLTRQSASVVDLNRHTRITMTYSPLFSTLVFWTLRGKDFYCLEPWTAGRNALNTGDRLLHLAPGESLETLMDLTVAFDVG